jgi:hypothetical protein
MSGVVQHANLSCEASAGEYIMIPPTGDPINLNNPTRKNCHTKLVSHLTAGRAPPTNYTQPPFYNC